MKTLRKSLLILFALVAFGQISWAQAYITDVVVIGANSSGDADWYYDNYVGAGWEGKERDLNDGAGGHYIHLMYKTNNSPQNSGTPINDFYLRVSDNPYAPASLTHLGRTYWKVGCDGDSQFINSGGDLNCGASGYFIHLYYTKEANSPVRCHFIQFDASPYSPCNAVGMNGSTTAADLNLGAGGDDIFMHVYKHLAGSPAQIYTEGQLHDAVAITEGTLNLKLMSNINLSKGLVIGDIDHGRSNTVTLDLNGYTLNRGLTSATQLGSVIRVEPWSTLTLNDGSAGHTGTITGGRTQQSGGGICNHGTLTVNGCTITGCTADSYGGGIVSGKLTSYNYPITYWPEMHLNSTTITGCQSTSGGGLGVINYAGDGLNITYATGCTFSNNTATNEGGGAINFTYLEMTNCTVTGNTALDVGGFYNAANGTALVTGCTFTNNDGTNGAGALANAINAQTFYLTDNTITGNTAGTRGAGIWNGSTINMSGSHTITGNTAVGNGGGIYNGGTLNVEGGTLVVNNNLKGSEANNLYLDSGMPFNVAGAFNTASDIHVSAENLIAPITSGYSTHNAGVAPNTLFTADNGRDITLINNEVFQTATLNVEVANYGELVAAVNNTEYNFINITLMANFSMNSGLTVKDNKIITVDLNGYTLTCTGANAFTVNSGNQLTIIDGSASQTGTITGASGGAIINSGTFTLNAGTFTGNSATSHGAAIWNGSGATTIINGGAITSNTGSGAAIWNDGYLTMYSGSVTGNTASYGGLYNGGMLYMQGNPVVSGNTTDGSSPHNVWLPSDKTINVVGAFTTGARIGLASPVPTVTFTSGYGTYNPSIAPSTFFFSDLGYFPTLNNNGEVVLNIPSGNWIADGNRAPNFSHIDGWTIYIENAAELALVAYRVKQGMDDFFGVTFRLNTDLDMSAHEWTPIGNNNHVFRGSFLGQGHTINGIYVNSTADYVGLFGYVQGGGSWEFSNDSIFICDFVLTNSYIKGGESTGGIAGYAYMSARIHNVVCDATVIGTNHVGGIVGRTSFFEFITNNPFRPNIYSCLFKDGTVMATTATGNHATIIGTIGQFTLYSQNYYVNPASATGSSTDVRAYPVTKSLPFPEGITVSYDISSQGIVHNDTLYYPVGTMHFTVGNDLAHHATSVKVNGTQVGTTSGDYYFPISSATEAYEINVTAETYNPIGQGTEEQPYEIWSTTDWNTYAGCLNGGSADGNYSGKYFKLMADITIDKSMGNNAHPFCGNFDGNSHTLTLAFGSSESYCDHECAAFYHLDNATIENLAIAGSIYSSAQHNASLAVKAYGNNNHIENCLSSVSIHSDLDGDCTNGGFIGIINSNNSQVYFNGCAFTGQFVGANATNWGGFVGWREFIVNVNTNYVHFTDCLFAPTTVNIATSEGGYIRTFCRSKNNTTSGATYTNSYYSQVLQAADGGKQRYSITAGTGVTVANAGATTEYSVSGITGYSTGIKYNDMLYAGYGDNVSLNLTGAPTGQIYITNAGALTGSHNPYTLTMDDVNTVVSLWTPVYPHEIATIADWNNFCLALRTGYDYQGQTVTMTANVDNITTQAGSSTSPFRGTFDGGNHTLTLAFGTSESYSDQKCAPFYRLDNATIKNLAIAGSIYSSAQHNAGFTVTATGDNNHIQNCVSSVSIHSDRSGDCINGGFIGILNGNYTHVYFNGCAFIGELVGQNATNWGGFVGWREYIYASWELNDNPSFVHFTDCLFAPTMVNIATPEGSNSRTFCRSRDNSTDGATYTNSYYSQALQDADGGKQMYSITAGEGVTSLENAGTATTYTVIGITSYGKGIKYNGVLYGGNGDNVSLTITGTSTIGRYISNDHLLTGISNPYTLTMAAQNAVVAAWDVEVPTVIASLDDWNTFCDFLSIGYDYQGETVTMTANVDNITTQAGSSTNPFRGTFDGDGHTLTLAFGSSNSYSNKECAAFYRIDNATIQNLAIAGSIYSSAQHNGGLAVKIAGNNLVQNCVSSVSINSNRNGDCTNGGFIGILDSNGGHVSFEGCAFRGELMGTQASNWGGFVGWRYYENNRRITASFTDCLFAPTNISIATPSGSNSRTFCRQPSSTGADYTNCYYKEVLQGADGGKQRYSISGGAEVTVANAGTATAYNVSGITSYGTGVKYSNVLYAGNGDNVSLTLNYTGSLTSYGYQASAGTLNVSVNPYTLTVPNGNVVISAIAGVTREIEGYGTGTGKWAFIASPVEGSIAPTAVGNIFDAAEYDLYRLNPSTMRWENYKSHEGNAAAGFDLLNGRGYLYATKETKTLTFTGAYNTETNKTLTGLPAGFNLVGNPFIVDTYINKPYYTLNETGSAIVAEPVGSSIPISPCYGVIVELDGTESVTFNTTGVFSAGPSNGGLNIALSQMGTWDTGRGTTGREALIDNAIVTFNEGSELGKFYFGEQNANIYLPQGGKDYAIAYSEGVGEMPLNFKARKNGEYTLTISSPFTSHLSPFTYLHLIDNLTGNDVDLLATSSYTFTGKTSDYASRFKLVFVANENENDNENFAFICNGEIIINGEGIVQVIDILGRQLFSSQATSDLRLPTSDFTSGVYVLRLINGDNVKTQKIVVN